MFVLDSSASLGIDNWNAVKSYAASIVDQLPIEENGIRFDEFSFVSKLTADVCSIVDQ